MNDNEVYDVLIVGGGVAGLSLACLLANNGYHVAVLEKDEYPKHRVCGEYVSMQSKPFLESIGINIVELELPSIRNLHVTDTRGNEVITVLPFGGFGISRYLLDETLAKQVVDSGALLYTKTKVDQVEWQGEKFAVTAGDETFYAKVVCGSWGKRSNIDIKRQRDFTHERSTKLNNYVGIKYHIQGDLPKDVVYLHNFTSGYCGVSPIEDDKFCLCYLTTANALRRSGNEIERLEQEVLSRNKWLKDIFQSAEFVKETPLAISQISFEKKEQVHDHVLMVGDAAGMITPLCGNGMTMAFHSATLAGALIELFLRGHITRNDMEKGYTDAWNRAFASRTAIGRAVQNNFGKDSTTALFLTAMKHITPVRNAIVKKLSGEYF